MPDSSLLLVHHSQPLFLLLRLSPGPATRYHDLWCYSHNNYNMTVLLDGFWYIHATIFRNFDIIDTRGVKECVPTIGAFGSVVIYNMTYAVWQSNNLQLYL